MLTTSAHRVAKAAACALAQPRAVDRARPRRPSVDGRLWFVGPACLTARPRRRATRPRPARPAPGPRRTGLLRRPAHLPGRARGLPGLWLLGPRYLKVALGEFLHVDVLERNNPHVLYKPRRAVHVPHPGILHGDLEVHLAVVRGADLKVDVVGEVEPPLCLDHVAEQADDIPVFAVELQLHLGFVLFEIFRAHALPSAPAPEASCAVPADEARLHEVNHRA